MDLPGRRRRHGGHGGDARRSSALSPPSYPEPTVRGRRIKRMVQVWSLGVGALKTELYQRLKIAPDDEAEALVSFGRFFGQEEAKQISAEKLVRRRTRTGHVRLEWILENHARNELLDLACYCLAAAMAARVDRWTAHRWAELEEELEREGRKSRAPVPAPPARRSGVSRSRWLDS